MAVFGMTAPRTLRQAARTLEELAAELNREAQFASTPEGVGLKQALSELRDERQGHVLRVKFAEAEAARLRGVLKKIADGTFLGHTIEGIPTTKRLSRKDMRRLAREAVEA